MIETISEKVQQTHFIDTHEHLLEESQRLAGPASGAPIFTCDDWAYLFAHYALDDLRIAGMTPAEADAFISSDHSPKEKWQLFAPYWASIRQTGYGKAVQYSIRILYGIGDLSEDSVDALTDRMRRGVKKGYYYSVLRDTARIEACHVNSLDRTFRVTEYPDLLYQDLSTITFGSDLNIEQLRAHTGLPVNTLAECYQAIDWHFEEFGQQAIATKNQSAYSRRLDYADVSAEDATPIFARLAAGDKTVSPLELKAVQDHLWRYSVQRSTDYHLPVKLHTGYFAGTGRMPLSNVSQNLKDLCPILQSFPDTTFVLMHITYPYQDELIALAKQYANVYVDLCWAWIVNPKATVRFVEEFLTAVPANKIFGFGGDYTAVENVVGHAYMARQGLALALSNLVEDGWCTEQEALDIVEPIMRGNAYSTFRMAQKHPSTAL